MMSKNITIFVLFSLFIILDSASVRRKKRETIVNNVSPNWTFQPSNYSEKSIDIRLRDPSRLHDERTEYIHTNSSQRGLIEIVLPGAPESLFLCFPQNIEEYRQAYIFSHIICRQLGFMTFISMNSKRSSPTDDKLFLGLKPNSFSCTGQEQNVSHCEWNNVNSGSCKTITDLSCGDCQYALKDSSGFIEIPGYPLVNLHDITCEWDLMIEEDHSVSLAFHHFQSLFTTSSKLFCSLHEPYMDVMYGTRNKMSFQRYCNLDDIINTTIPLGRVKIRIFTGIYAPYAMENETLGKGVAITFEAKPTEVPINWPWKITFVALFIIICLIISALFHYCKKYRICNVRRNTNTLPTVSTFPTMADIDRAYELQRCAIQRPLKEKMGLRMRSNGSGEKIKNMLFPTPRPDETFVITSEEKKDLIAKENLPHIYDETPRTIIPQIVLSGVSDDNLDSIDRVKVNLLDRYSKSSDVSGISSRISTSSPVFFPPRKSFQIYSSVSSDPEKEDKEQHPPPNESTL